MTTTVSRFSFSTTASPRIRLAIICGFTISVVTTCLSMAQDPAGNPAGLRPTANASANDSGEAETTDTQKPGIPSDPLGIANAMGRSFTIAFVIASIVAVWSIIERLVVLRHRRVIPRAFVDRFLMQLRAGRMDKSEAVAVCQQNASPIADVFLHGIRKWGRPSAEIEQAITDGGERQLARLKRGLRILNGVSTISPLIGLLGTVVGMIQSFNDIATAGAMGQTETLAHGIALALLTTAVGLLIAIPVMIAYLYLAGRVDAIVQEMDRLSQELVHLISAESLRERAIVAPLSADPVAPPSRSRKPVVEQS
jgi:biopolymer transport protein ExbB